MSDSYRSAGVDLKMAGAIKARIAKIADRTLTDRWATPVGGFGGVVEPFPGAQSLLVASTDGVGTKVRIHAAMKRWELSGFDVVNHCVNDILPTGATPILFLDYIAMGSYSDEATLKIVEGVADACRAANCALVGGETAAMGDFYTGEDYDLVGFIVGTVDRDKLLRPLQTVVAGDQLLGLPSSGLHTNGFSLVRKLFDLDQNRSNLTRRLEDGSTLGEALSVPHRSYLKELGPVLDSIKGLAHITGGGVFKNIPRILPPQLGVRINTTSWDVPPLFSLIQSTGGMEKKEMFSVFNMGLGMVIVVSAEGVAELKAKVPGSWLVGEVVSLDHNEDQKVLLL